MPPELTPSSHGAPKPGPGRAAPDQPCPIPRTSATTTTSRPHSGRWSTWTSTLGHRCARSLSTPSSSVHAPMAESRIYARGGRRAARGATSPTWGAHADRPGSMKVRAQAEGEGLGEIHLRRRRMAPDRLLDVSGHEPDQLAPGSGARRPPTAISRGVRVRWRTHLVSPAVAAVMRGTVSAIDL